jgi:ABC-type dipeptide/oligopeptide/nickel transport system permease component
MLTSRIIPDESGRSRAVVLLASAVLVVANLIVDALYSMLDPRVRLA